MPPISKIKRDKISEQILHYLFSISPESNFTSKIAEQIIRDEEFTKALLKDLEKNKLIVKIKKSSSGLDYIRRERWRLSNEAYDVFKKYHPNENSQ
ncbi:hypothetical protein COU60_01205 [Candidatus Pacearchaeota archaeon CG10_big_fil_rev_8_21_14_0_10_34_76]|nr:MAG: hypothetical protein COU60_01205 [Candidatus Pacearchaeota archaeon CG10_big_fil_rev_8_21_14_0_10_34_76]